MAQGKQQKKKNKRNEKRKQKANADAKRGRERNKESAECGLMSLGLALIQCRPRPPAMTYLINTFVVTFAFLRCGSGPKVD